MYEFSHRQFGISGRLLDYQIRAVTSGKDAMGEVSVLVECGDLRISGRAASTDILEASAQAYIVAMNRIAALQNGAGKNNTSESQ